MFKLRGRRFAAAPGRSRGSAGFFDERSGGDRQATGNSPGVS